MSIRRFALSPIVMAPILIAATALLLRAEGRRWWCRCGSPAIWASGVGTERTSQHVFDPYSFTHVLHGVLLYAILRPLAKWIGPGRRMALAVLLECGWEILENSPAVIDRYRDATTALGYRGDSVANSIGDILSCLLGFLLASRLPTRASIATFVAIEAAMLLLYRDNLTLNIVMLVCPMESLKTWQMHR